MLSEATIDCTGRFKKFILFILPGGMGRVNSRLKVLLSLLIILNSVGVLRGQRLNSEVSALRTNWDSIQTFFSPPHEYKEVYGTYRSPLKFYNGDSVRSAQDWTRRRKEILNKWHKMMGEWPPLLKDQQMQVLDSVRKEGFTQFNIRFKWLPNEETDGYLLVPDGKEKMPAVIAVYYEPETAAGLGDSLHPNRDFAYQLAKRGFVTLSLGTTKGTNDKTYSLYYPGVDNAQVQPLSMLAYAAANAWYVLSKIPQVDSTKIGIMGHSYGGKWAMFASCLFKKFSVAVWSDPGIVFDEKDANINYWEPWYLGYHPRPWRQRGLITNENPAKGLYPMLVREGFDLHELHALMAPRPFLVSGGSADKQERWIPLNHTIKVNQMLNHKERVAMTNRPAHGPTTESNEQAYLFLEHFLKYNPVYKNQ